MEEINRQADAVRQYVLSQIPEDRNSRLLLAAGTLTVAAGR